MSMIHRLAANRSCSHRFSRLRPRALPRQIVGALLAIGAAPLAHTAPVDVLARGSVGCAALHGLADRDGGCGDLPAALRTVAEHVAARSAPARFLPADRPRQRRSQTPARGPAVIAVTTCADAGAGSLRAAVETAVSGDAIDLTQLSCSVITLTTGTLEAEVETLTINGPGAERLSISGNGAQTVLVHAGTEGARGSLTLNDVSIVDGRNQHGTSGGCVFAYGDLILTRTTIDSCRAPRVAGALVSGDLTMTDSRITRTTSATDNYLTFGGAAMVYGGATIIGSTISGNSLSTSSTIGGAMAAGIRVQGGDLTVVRSEIAHNVVAGRIVVAGAGIWTHSGDVLVVDSVIRDNVLAPYIADFPTLKVGAGIAVQDGDLTMIGSTVHHNHANDAFNGGIHVQQLYDTTRIPNVYVANSTLSMNSAAWGAGGLGTWQTNGLTLHNSTVFGNVVDRASDAFDFASPGSGGVWHQSDEAVFPRIDVSSSIIHGNSRNDTASAADLDAWHGTGSASLGAIAVEGARNLVGAAGSGVVVPVDTLTDDPQLQPLADNGGPTPTHAPSQHSPARDAGDAGAFEFDQRGPSFPRVVGAAADIGAIEWTPSTPADRIFAYDFEPIEGR